MVSGKQDVCSISDANKRKGAKILVDQNKMFWVIVSGHFREDWGVGVEVLKIISAKENIDWVTHGDNNIVAWTNFEQR